MSMDHRSSVPHPNLPRLLPRSRFQNFCNGVLFTSLPPMYMLLQIDPDSTVLASDAAMRTSAAPTYFPVGVVLIS
jgi:hypothetical protein